MRDDDERDQAANGGVLQRARVEPQMERQLLQQQPNTGGLWRSERYKSWRQGDHQHEHKAPPLREKFNRDLQQLGFFLAHVLIYMEEYGCEIPTEGAKVRVVTLALEGAAARWMVTLHNANTPELQNFYTS